MLISQASSALGARSRIRFSQLYETDRQLYARSRDEPGSYMPHEKAMCEDITSLFIPYRVMRDVETLREDIGIWLSVLPSVNSITYSAVGGMYLSCASLILSIHIDHPSIAAVVGGNSFADVFEMQEFLLSKLNESAKPNN